MSERSSRIAPQAAPPPARLRALHPGPLAPEWPLAASGQVLGRDPEQADILLQGPTLSRAHAWLGPDQTGTWLIRDLNSTNGLYVDGGRIDRERALRGGEAIGLGQAESPDFEFLLGPGERRLTLPGRGPWLLGRRPDHPVSLPADPLVSQDHARLSRHGDALLIEDLGSRNGCWRNGRRLARGPLRPGERLRIGDHYLERIGAGASFELQLSPATAALGLRAQALRLSGQTRVDFELAPGQFALLPLADAAESEKVAAALAGEISASGRIEATSGRRVLGPGERRERIARIQPLVEVSPDRPLIRWLDEQAELALADDLDSVDRAALINNLLAQLSLDDQADCPWRALDALSRLLAALIAALLTRPGLIILDRPERWLTAAEQSRLADLLRRLAGSRLSILLVSADNPGLPVLPVMPSPSPSANAARTPPDRRRPRRASLGAFRVLLSLGLASATRPVFALEPLVIGLLLFLGLARLPGAEPAWAAILALGLCSALAAALQASIRQRRLLANARRHGLLDDGLGALWLASALPSLLAATVLAAAAVSLDGSGSAAGWALGLSLIALAPGMLSLGLACGLWARGQPALALALVVLIAGLMALANAYLYPISYLSLLFWADQLHQALNERGPGAGQALAALLGGWLLLFALARIALARDLNRP